MANEDDDLFDDDDDLLERARVRSGRVNPPPKPVSRDAPSISFSDLKYAFPQEDDATLVKIGKMLPIIIASFITGDVVSGAVGGSGGASGAVGGSGGASGAVGGGGATGVPSSPPAALGTLGPVDIGGGGGGSPWWKEVLPWAKEAIPFVPGVIDWLHTSDREKELAEMEEEIFANRKERLAQLRRHAIGDFTTEEREQMSGAYEPTYDRLASNLAARGISQTGAAGQIIAQAQLQPFLQAQKLAASMLDNYELGTLQLTRQLMQDDDDFYQGVETILTEIMTTEQEKEVDSQLEQLNENIKFLENVVKQYQKTLESYQ